MFRVVACRIDANLSRGLDEAILEVSELELHQARCPIQASERLAAAQAAWIAHKLSCGLCCGQQIGIIH
jgi:hypothetical protein